MIIRIPEGQLWALQGVTDEKSKSTISLNMLQPQIHVRPHLWEIRSKGHLIELQGVLC